jgi:SAM-dependent methyltransferase
MDTLLDKIIRELRLQKVLPLIPVNGTILDLGSGDPPHLLLKIERKINAGFGIDKQLKPQPLTSKIKLIEQDLDRNPSLPFEDNFFDVVTMTAVIEHLTRPPVVLGEVKRVLKKGGF